MLIRALDGSLRKSLWNLFQLMQILYLYHQKYHHTISQTVGHRTSGLELPGMIGDKGESENLPQTY